MKKIFIQLLAVACICTACEEIISVPDISEELVRIVAPSDGSLLTQTSVNFSWETIEFAEQFQVQVASPSFGNATAVVLDTIVGDSAQSIRRFQAELQEANYQWRVRGLNSNYSTPYMAASFSVDTTEVADDISSIALALIAPAAEAVIETQEVQFTWSSIAEADNYVFQVAYPDFVNPVQVVENQELDQTSIEVTLENNGYQWRVKAMNQDSETAFSTRSFVVDDGTGEIDLSLENVTLLAPAIDAVLTETEVSFTWSAVEGATNYSLQVARPNFTNPVQILVNENLDSSDSQTFTIPEGEYEWRVKAQNPSSETNYAVQPFSVVLGTDLSTQTLVLVAPSLGTIVNSSDVNFTWDALNAADSYQLQIARPNFTNPVQIVVDQTYDSAATQSFVLSEGAYEWRVKGINASSETRYTTHAFEVDFDAELSDQTIVIISPIDGFATTNTSVNLQWEPLSQAILYRVIITDTNTGDVYLEQTTTNTVLGVNFVTGTYEWKVRGESASQNTVFTTQTLLIQ